MTRETPAGPRAGGTPGWIVGPAFDLAFIIGPAVLALAWGEEALWDNLIWHERAAVFGDVRAWFAPDHPGGLLSLLVPLLALPQATHYVLDAFLWRFDGSNPGLADHLFGEQTEPAAPAGSGGSL